jgi:hypothetical protein
MGNSLMKAYVRGIAERLLATGGVKVASIDHAALVADTVAERCDYPIWEKAATADLVATLADEILKLAEEPRLIDGKPGQENTLSNAASDAGSLASLEQSERPQGEYLEGPGKTQVDTSSGEVGRLQEHPDSSKQDAPNSVNEDAKMAALAQKLIEKLNEARLITGDRPDQKNTLENAAAQASGLASMEARERPTGQHLVGVGNTQMSVPASGVVGQEQVLPPGQIGSPASPAPVNSLVAESSKSASFEEQFKATAAQILPLLPQNMNETDKIAAVRTCMGLSTVERLQYLTKLSEEGGDMMSEEVPEEEKCPKCGKPVSECECGSESEPSESMSEEEKEAALNLLKRLTALSS